jgi:hypothetical protein
MIFWSNNLFSIDSAPIDSELNGAPQLWAYYSPWQCNLGGLFLADNNPIGAMVAVAVSHTLFEISLQCNDRITF